MAMHAGPWTLAEAKAKLDEASAAIARLVHS